MDISLEQMKRDATDSATWRGHKLSPFHHYNSDRAFASCRDCGMEVHVNRKPQPNEIDIGGEAVALNCKWRA